MTNKPEECHWLSICWASICQQGEPSAVLEPDPETKLFRVSGMCISATFFSLVLA